MDKLSDYICGTKQQIQAAYDWLVVLNSQGLDWAMAVDDIRESRKADGATRIVVWREAAMRAQRTFEALQDANVLRDVLEPCIWDTTVEIWEQASNGCIAIRRACSRGGYSTEEFKAWGKAHNDFKDLVDTLRDALEIALEQAEDTSIEPDVVVAVHKNPSLSSKEATPPPPPPPRA